MPKGSVASKVAVVLQPKNRKLLVGTKKTTIVTKPLIAKTQIVMDFIAKKMAAKSASKAIARLDRAVSPGKRSLVDDVILEFASVPTLVFGDHASKKVVVPLKPHKTAATVAPKAVNGIVFGSPAKT